ncbi:MAC/perforin domain-containing protein [Altererythrobacter sp. ZODW24]|uniref:MAC/perforin domain-containing protein n=1 Tax=Altererythrobacter sp. ZODW24 TaxID=2185142 RepID=UPI0013B4269D|nr:MAC/perforin domain-containing protein [Altererythrobacter sp. ZODW24]
MNKTRILLAIGATTITGAGLYAADSYFNDSSSNVGDLKIAESPEFDADALATNCGLTSGTDASDSDRRVISQEVTRARVTAARPIEASDDPSERMKAGDCRYRLDGVWSQDTTLALDNSVAPDIFEGDDDGAGNPSLMHGTFVTIRHLLISASEDGNELVLRDAMGGSDNIVVRAADDVPMSEVFAPGGAVKKFASSDGVGEVEIDVTQTGRVRIRIDGENYYRPLPVVSETTSLDTIDSYMINFNLDNLAATRRGYDAYEQDAFFLNQNNKAEVFKAALPTEYAVVEKRTVPLGFKLVPEGAQGTVINSTLIRTEQELQRTVSWNMGASASAGLKGAKKGIGASYAQTNTEGMRSSTANSISTGYARHKLYALVLDQPFVRLSDEFVDAVEDARRHGRYQEIIKKFGTHYPYAMTYGSSMRMTAEFSEETVSNWNADSSDINAKAMVPIKGVQVGVSGGRYEATEQKDGSASETRSTKFDAVGGTGHTNMESNGTGTPYPILADLRPLHELLSPLNFPDQPEVYTKVRAELQAAISAYLEANSRNLSDTPYLMKRAYRIEPRKVWCDKVGGGVEHRIELVGSLSMALSGTRGSARNQSISVYDRDKKTRIKLNCNKGDGEKRVLDQGEPSIIAKGTRDELVGATIKYTGTVEEYDAWSRNDRISITNSQFILPVTNLKAGESKVFTFSSAHPKNGNRVTFSTRVTRLSTEEAQ